MYGYYDLDMRPSVPALQKGNGMDVSAQKYKSRTTARQVLHEKRFFKYLPTHVVSLKLLTHSLQDEKYYLCR